MRKEIKFGGEMVAFEANLGTSDLFEALTGKNLFVAFGAYTGAKANGADALRYAGVIDLYKKLAYVMNVQATAPDIPTMRGKMNFDSYLEWTFKYSIEDFTREFTDEIAGLWKATNTSHVESKNQ